MKYESGKRCVRLLEWLNPIMGVDNKVLKPGKWKIPSWAPNEFFDAHEEALATFCYIQAELEQNEKENNFPYPSGDYRLELCPVEMDGDERVIGDAIESFEKEIP